MERLLGNTCTVEPGELVIPVVVEISYQLSGCIRQGSILKELLQAGTVKKKRGEGVFTRNLFVAGGEGLAIGCRFCAGGTEKAESGKK